MCVHVRNILYTYMCKYLSSIFKLKPVLTKKESCVKNIAVLLQSENVMATDRGVVPHITLIDFGSARFTPIGSQVMMDIPAGSIDFVGTLLTTIPTLLLI